MSLCWKSFIVYIAILQASVTGSNQFADALDEYQLSRPSCRESQNKLANHTTALDEDFQWSSLFFSTPKTVCKQVDLVINASKVLAANCDQNFTPTSEDVFQRQAIYAIWSNEKAAKAACAPSKRNPDYSFCMDEVHWQVNTRHNKTKLCTDCQRQFWTSFNLQDGRAPVLYYWNYMDQKAYIDKLKRICGQDFFLTALDPTASTSGPMTPSSTLATSLIPSLISAASTIAIIDTPEDSTPTISLIPSSISIVTTLATTDTPEDSTPTTSLIPSSISIVTTLATTDNPEDSASSPPSGPPKGRTPPPSGSPKGSPPPPSGSPRGSPPPPPASPRGSPPPP